MESDKKDRARLCCSRVHMYVLRNTAACDVIIGKYDRVVSLSKTDDAPEIIIIRAKYKIMRTQRIIYVAKIHPLRLRVRKTKPLF